MKSVLTGPDALLVSFEHCKCVALTRSGENRLSMNKSELELTLRQAIAKLFEHQPNIFEFTPETGQTEWNLTHHLAIEIHALFPSLDYDLDVVKRDYNNMRPDIVIHKRGTHTANHLVVEVKRNGDSNDVDADIEKIKRHWFRAPLRYQFGAVINLRTDGKHEIQVFKNPAIEHFARISGSG
jgi:hypothetical protein